MAKMCPTAERHLPDLIPWQDLTVCPRWGPDINMRPVASVVFDAKCSHYYTVVLNHKRLHVVTFGNNTDKDGQHFDTTVDVWGGENLWKNVCKVFRWEVPRRKPTWWAVDMRQVS